MLRATSSYCDLGCQVRKEAVVKEVVIAGYLRTAQSRSRPNAPERDWFHKLRADELLAALVPELVEQTGVAVDAIDDFIVGCSEGVGEQWTYGGRTPLFLANMSEKTAAKFVDQQCGSGMAAIHIGYLEIATGNADIVVAGGMENMTRVPMDIAEPDINQNFFSEEMYRRWDMDISLNMGLTAEKLADRAGITRQEMDDWALRSQQRAAQAMKEGFMRGEILPIEAEQGDGNKVVIDHDQAIRTDTCMADLEKLRTVFKENGSITAGNASPLNAGAAAMMMMAKNTAGMLGIKPLATVRAIGFAGVDPTLMGLGPIPASKKALKMAGLGVEDIDYWEINEAFCVVAQNCINALGIDPERVNVKGGGVAIGHPLGATGIRLVGTLARILNEKKGRYGLANACVGGGQGVATVIEREDDL